jgi:hypothetical protein
MNARPNIIIATLLIVLLHAATAACEDCRVMVLRESESGVVLERVTLVEGEELVFEPGEVVSVILPFGVGMSGDVIQAENRTAAIGVLCDGGYIRTTIRPDGGEPRLLPDVLLADAIELDMRVNVTPGEGEKRAFVVRGYETVESADGPVVDMFGGAIPISAGEYSITTETTPAEDAPHVVGAVPLRVSDGFLLVSGRAAGGEDELFVVDFGAGGTVVTRDFLPAGTEIDPLLAVEHSPDGVRELPGVMTGAGGDVEGFLGAALIHELILGEVVVPHPSVGVIGEMPVWGEEPIAGILGLDVLDAGGVASVTLGLDGDGLLEFRPAGEPVPDGAVELPFTTAADHIFVEGALGDVSITFLFDTGARSTIVPLGLADAAALSAGSLPDRDFRGLDGAYLPARSVRAEGFELSGVPFDPFDIYAADLPVLEGLGLDEESGLLGIDFILQFGRIDVDFSAGVIRLWREAP